MRDGEIVLELRGDTLWFGNQSTVVTGDLRTFALELGRSPRKAASYKALNEAVYAELYAQNTDRLRQLASELRRRLAALGLTPTNEYLPQGSRQGYLLMVEIRENVSAPDVWDAGTTAVATNGDVAVDDSATEPPCPYRGLDVFREEDAPYFAGREAFSEELLRLARTTDFVALVGPSGSGKSSIVQAGLIPLLRSRSSTGTTWNTVIFAPGDDPFFALASKLIPLLTPDLGPTDLMNERRRLASSLTDGTLPLKDPLNEARQRGEFERLLLVVDQFEELFTSTPLSMRRGFAEALVQLKERDNVCVLLTLRADFYSQAISLSRMLSDQLGRAVVNVGAMSREELARAMTKPAADAGICFQPGLVDTILADVGDEAGSLPLLEFALLQLWQRRRRGGELTLEAYRDIGGASGALARHAQAVYDKLRPHEQAIARRVLLRLIVPGEGGNHTRQRVAIADLLGREDAVEVERVVQVLADNRLLTTSRDALTGARFVEVSHEALIRSWALLGEWIEAERDWLREYRRLSDAAREWRRHGDEGLLYRGARLADVARLGAEHAADLSRDEEAFLADSVRLEARRERARYLGQAAGGAVGTGLGYGAAFALGFATTNPGPNAVILTGATFAFLFVVGQLTGFAIGIALWVWHANRVLRSVSAVLVGACVGMLGYLVFLRFLLNGEPTPVRAAVGALVAGCLALGLAVSRRRQRRIQGALVGSVIGTTAAVTIGGITWSSPVTLAAGMLIGMLSGAGFYFTSAEDDSRAL